MADIDDLKPSDAYQYFKDTLFPFGVSRYQLRQNNVPSTSSDGRFQEPMVIDTLIQCIQVYNISIKKVNFLFVVLNIYMYVYIYIYILYVRSLYFYVSYITFYFYYVSL